MHGFDSDVFHGAVSVAHDIEHYVVPRTGTTFGEILAGGLKTGINIIGNDARLFLQEFRELNTPIGEDLKLANAIAFQVNIFALSIPSVRHLWTILKFKKLELAQLVLHFLNPKIVQIWRTAERSKQIYLPEKLYKQ